MRSYSIVPVAEQELESQINYLIGQGAQIPAQKLLNRVHRFIGNSLCRFPATGHYVKKRDLWEIWIPGTRVVLWYRFDDTSVVLLYLWHMSRNRTGKQKRKEAC